MASIGIGVFALAIGSVPAFSAKPVVSKAKETEALERVWITRPDGSLQCDPKDEGTQNDPIRKAKAELSKAGVKILESKKRNDGALRAAACGIATGNETSFLIEKRDLPKAKRLGFVLLAPNP